jgi:hypothetical protein
MLLDGAKGEFPAAVEPSVQRERNRAVYSRARMRVAVGVKALPWTSVESAGCADVQRFSHERRALYVVLGGARGCWSRKGKGSDLSLVADGVRRFWGQEWGERTRAELWSLGMGGDRCGKDG